MGRVVSRGSRGGGNRTRAYASRAPGVKLGRANLWQTTPARVAVALRTPSGEMEPSPAPLTRRWQTVWRHLAVLVVPAAYLAATAWATHEVRPLWMGGSTDPTYPYVLNSLLVAEGRSPAQATHPGTPLQALGAVVLRAAHRLSGSTLDLRRHVLSDPEYFTDAFRGTLVALIALAAIAQGLAALHLTGSALCAMAAQAAPMASVWTVRSSILVMSETLVLALGFAVSATVLRSLRRGPEASPREAALVGALVGIAVATKVMYVSLALLPLVWLRRARLRLVAAGALGRRSSWAWRYSGRSFPRWPCGSWPCSVIPEPGDPGRRASSSSGPIRGPWPRSSPAIRSSTVRSRSSWWPPLSAVPRIRRSGPLDVARGPWARPRSSPSCSAPSSRRSPPTITCPP